MTTSTVKFTNFASTTLVGTYGTGDTALTVASATAFPSVSGGTSWFYAVITDSLTAPTKREVVKVTNVSGSIFTVTRAQDGTSAQTWATGSYIELRVVNKALQDLFDEAVSTGSAVDDELSSTTNITITADSDDNGSGGVLIKSGPDTVVEVKNNGELIANPSYANIKQFGGDPTGATNTVTAFNNAIAAGYTSIYFPKGTYLFTAGVSVTNQNLKIFGDGPQNSIINCDSGGAGFNFLTFTGAYNQYDADQLIVEDISILTSCDTTTAQGVAIGAAFSSAAGGDKNPRTAVYINNVEITSNVDNACWAACVQLDTAQLSKISNSYFSGYMMGGSAGRKGVGIDIFSDYIDTNNGVKATDINITNCTVFQADVGIRVNINGTGTAMNVEGVHVTGCTILNCNTGIAVGNNASISADGLPGWFIEGNHITATNYGVDLQTVSQFIIENNLFYSIGGTNHSSVRVISSQTVGAQVDGVISDNTFIRNGTYSGNTYGINFAGASATPGILSVRVSNNAFENYTNAVICDANTSGVVIAPDNRVLSGGSYTGTLSTTNIASGFNAAVGIGRTPLSRLDVYDGSTNATIGVESGSGYGSLSIKSSGTNSSYINFYNATGERSRFRCQDNETLYWANGAGATDRIAFGSLGSLYLLTNNASIYFKDSGGTDRQIINYYIDDGLYIGNPKSTENFYIQINDGAWVFRNTNGSSDRLTLTNGGSLYGNALHNNANAMTGTTNQFIGSGTYTPTLTGVTNVAASTNYTCQYTRVGNVVTVSGKFDLDVTGAGATELRISLPIASNFTNASNLGGGCHRHVSAASEHGSIAADTTNDCAQVYINAVATGNEPWSFHFTYVVL